MLIPVAASKKVQFHVWLSGQGVKFVEYTVADITARKQVELRLRESEERYQRLFDSSPDPCWIIDASNRFILCNVAAARALGYDRPEEVIERHPSEYSPRLQPDGRLSRDAANEMIAVAHERGIHRFEWVHRRRNGEGG